MPAETVARDGQSHRRWPAWLFGGRLILGAVAVYGAYALLVERARLLEAVTVGWLLEPLTGGAVRADFARDWGLLYVYPDGADPFAARITESCTALVPIAVVTWVALCLTRGRLGRRGLGLAVSVVLLIVVDLSRISLVVLAGKRWGVDVMVITHDWAGTLMTLAAVVVGMLTLWTVTGSALPGRRRPLAAGW